ncbi:MAG: radical SAM protein [Spirochaetales bacterium]|nr:radical SAM protein [Spirochaetales bacterium]
MAVRVGKQLFGLSRLKELVKMSLNKKMLQLPLHKKLGFAFAISKMKFTKVGDKLYTNTFTPFYPSLAYDRYLDGVIKTSNGIATPIITNFAVTAKCPCNCWHCSFSDRTKKDQLTLKNLKQAISEVQDMGTSIIGITGGEPLLRSDLEEIIASIDERSMPIMFTTGYNLTKERVTKLIEAGLKMVIISVDHYDAEKHDKGRGKEGMHATALKAIKLFQEQNLYTAVSFVPNKAIVSDKEELYKILDFFKDLGLNDMRLTSPILSGQLTAKLDEKLTEENVKTVQEVQEFCSKTKDYPGAFVYDYFESDKMYGCGAGFHYIFIDSSGNVCPCDFAMLGMGNIREKSITEIWGEVSKHFKAPGCKCYANVISKSIEEKNAELMPLSTADSLDIIKKHPPFDKEKLPEFYKRMKFPIEEINR